ncbi:MAG: type II secretion system minor pseudopilin GspJ [Pseudomonadota bacterium]
MADHPARGFTLIEVLIALAITALVSALAYASLSAAIDGVEGTREQATRTAELNRAWTILSRDLRQFVSRPVRDEFGEVEPALLGGPASRYTLSFTRTGWHNPNRLARSNLQRVNYLVEEETLWREAWSVLDRAASSEAQRVRLLDGVEDIRLAFLRSLEDLEPGNEGVETRNWPESWVADPSQPGLGIAPPVAIEITLELADYGELRRLYVLPPL